MLVTALALFFSTFSSPLLSALLTLGLWVAGHFNGDLRHFENVLDLPGVSEVALALYYLLPEPGAVRRQGRSGARHRRRRSHVGVHAGVRGALHYRAAGRGHGHLPPAGLQVTAAGDARPLEPLAVCRHGCPGRTVDWRAGCSRSRLAAVRAAQPRAVAALGPSGQAPVRSGSTTSSADVYWIRAVVYYGGTRLGAMDPVRRNYGLLYPLLDLVTTLDPHFKVAYRFGAIFLTEALPARPGPARPGGAAARAGRAGRPAIGVGVHAGHRVRLLLVAAATTRRPRRGSSGPASSRARPRGWRPLAATTLARGRRPRLVAVPVDADLRDAPTSTGCAAMPSCGSRSSMRWMRSTRST